MADGNFPTLVSANTNANSSSNQFYVQLTDGTDVALIDGSGNINAILASNSGTDIGDVTINNAAGASAVNIQDGGNTITVDGSVTVTASDLDIRDLSVTQDSILVYANTVKDGSGTDYVPLVDADGHLQVDILSGGGSNASVIVDDSAFTPATSSVTAVGFFADETAPDSVDEGDIGAARMTLDRKQLNVLVDATTDSQRLAIDSNGSASVIAAANSGVDIGDVTINNAAGASAVNIQDGGNNISVDDAGGSLTIDNATLSVTGGGVEATALRVTIASDSTGLLSIDDNGGSLTVDSATHDTFNANANLQVGDTDVSSSNPVPVSKDGSANAETNPIYVYQVNTITSGSEIHDYDTQASLAGSGTDNHDYTVANTTFLLKSVIVAASGACKAEIQTGPVASLATDAVGFIPKQGGIIQLDFNPPIEVPVTSTGTVRVIRTNREGSAQDVYSTIIGNDV
jgi:hypothetical protein